MIKRVATPMKKRTLYYGNFQNTKNDSCQGPLFLEKKKKKKKKKSGFTLFFGKTIFLIPFF